MTVPSPSGRGVPLADLVLGNVYAGLPRVAALVAPLLDSAMPSKVRFEGGCGPGPSSTVLVCPRTTDKWPTGAHRSSAGRLICCGLNTPHSPEWAAPTPAKGIADQLMASLRGRSITHPNGSRPEAGEIVLQLTDLAAALASEPAGYAFRQAKGPEVARGTRCSCRVCVWAVEPVSPPSSSQGSARKALVPEDLSQWMMEAAQAMDAVPSDSPGLARSLREAATALRCPHLASAG